MSLDKLPQVPYGAVYFRKSNPPKEDWARDYGTASEDGMNVFRHWFMWSAIERKPGVYDWSDYDRQMELAEKNNIKTVIAELTHSAPEWAYRKFANARQIKADGSELKLGMGVSAATGGFAHNGAGPLTMNSPEVKEVIGAFLTELAARYKGHPALLGYDVWNEVNYAAEIDYSTWMKADYRKWLKAKYGDLETLSQAWYRYGHAEWDDVEPPAEVAAYPENLDWLQFKKENYYGQMDFKIATIRAVDKDCMIAAHGVGGAIPNMAANGMDDWLAASKVELYGLTWVPSRRGFKPWQNLFGPDITRAAARGKKWWHAERPAGPLWLQPQVLGHEKEDGRLMEPEDVRTLTMGSMACGASGILNLRWRPLLDGPLFGAFGAYGMDGSRTPRSEMQSKIGKWANAAAQKPVWDAKPVQGDIGLLVIPEAQAWDYLLNHNHKPETYREAMWGAYRGFLDNGLQPDWVHIDHIDEYDTIYAAYPIMLTSAHAKKIGEWVKKGGKLISEATPGYFGDRGKVGVVQPNNGLDVVFGVREAEVEFMPDLGDRIGFNLDGRPVRGGGFLQSYTVTTGKERGTFDGGRVAVVENQHGEGRTLLVGTNPGIAYFKQSNAENLAYFAKVFAWTGKTQQVKTSNANLIARLHEGPQGRVLWVLNQTREAQSGTVEVDGKAVAFGAPFWAEPEASVAGAKVTVPQRDVVVVRV